jgi:Icc-related predicted phosphoesterase
MKFHSYFFSGKAPEPTKEYIEKQEKIIADSTKTILENINESISTFYPPIDLASPTQQLPKSDNV